MWSAAIAAGSESGSGDPTAESSTCPCIDASSSPFVGSRYIVSAAVAEEMRSQPQEGCVAGSILGPYVGSAGVNSQDYFCYPPNYGTSGCAAYDVDLAGDHVCGSSSPPSWCASAWCYVDMEACRRSGLDVQGTVLFDGLNLYYSYGTCLDTEEGQEAALAFQRDGSPIATFGQGEVLAVGIPYMDYPTHFKRDSDGAVLIGVDHEVYFDDSVKWEGSMIDFLDEIVSVAPYAAFNYTYTSPVARLASGGSSWTATVYDVEKRLLDMGGSDFWVTAERAEMTAFSTSYHIDLHYLWVPRPKKDNSFVTVATRVFIPFSNELWALLISVTVAMSLVEVYLFRKDWRADGYDDWKEARGWRAKTRVLVNEWGTYLGRSAMHITAGFPDEGHTSAQTIAWIGWAFLIMIFVAAYTANLAAFMLRPNSGSYIKDMRSAIEAQKKICVPTALRGDMESRYPTAHLVDARLARMSSVALLESCDGIVMSLSTMKRQPPFAQIFCDIDVVAVEVVMESGWAFTASHDLAPSLSLWIQTLSSMGIKYTDTFESPYYSNTCDDVPRLLSRMQSTDDSRRSRNRSRRSRRLVGAGGAGAGASGVGGGTSVQESWFQIGIGDDTELERLPASTFSGVLIIWALFVTWGLLRSVWEQHEEDGLFEESIRHRREAESLKNGIMQMKNIELKLEGCTSSKLLSKPRSPDDATPTETNRPDVALTAPVVAANAAQMNGNGAVRKHRPRRLHRHHLHDGVHEVRGMIRNVESQMADTRGQIGEMRGMIQAILAAQQKAPEHHTRAEPSVAPPAKLRKRRSKQSRPATETEYSVCSV